MVGTEPKEIRHGLKPGGFPWSNNSRYRRWNLLEMLRLIAADWNEILKAARDSKKSIKPRHCRRFYSRT